MWKSKEWKVSIFLYIFCRYALPANLLYLLAIANKLGSSCDTWYKIIGAISVVGRASVITVFAMRTYAVCAQSKLVLYGLGAIGLTCVVLDCLHVPGLRCHGSSSIQIANTLLSILVCVFESIATALTVFRSVQALRAQGQSRNKKNTFHYLVLEQGVLYFGVVSLFTIAAVILNFRAPGGFFQRLLNAFTLPVSGLLTARFLLHIRAYTENSSASLSKTGGQAREQHTLSAFQAVRARVVDEFGEDPVARAEQDQAEEGDTGLDIIEVDRESGRWIERNGGLTGAAFEGGKSDDLMEGSSAGRTWSESRNEIQTHDV